MEFRQGGLAAPTALKQNRRHGCPQRRMNYCWDVEGLGDPFMGFQILFCLCRQNLMPVVLNEATCDLSPALQKTKIPRNTSWDKLMSHLDGLYYFRNPAYTRCRYRQ
jgi:hypothetical protein